ncbi:hypothetical protein BDR22DRAFT_886798 [Usnea florida]
MACDCAPLRHSSEESSSPCLPQHGNVTDGESGRGPAVPPSTRSAGLDVAIGKAKEPSLGKKNDSDTFVAERKEPQGQECEEKRSSSSSCSPLPEETRCCYGYVMEGEEGYDTGTFHFDSQGQCSDPDSWDVFRGYDSDARGIIGTPCAGGVLCIEDIEVLQGETSSCKLLKPSSTHLTSPPALCIDCDVVAGKHSLSPQPTTANVTVRYGQDSHRKARI